jgi:putative heme-binding domain-containing protein
LVFNEAGQGRKSFGPSWWEGDAFVAGESRGKVWRVRLVKTPAGYLGKEILIARLNMLTTDVAVSSDGDLYVSCHSGDPDWGTGPQGQGKLFKISYTDAKAPQPVAVWASSAMEVRIEFDRPIDSGATNRLEEMRIALGEFVSAADRLEVLKPPYKAVQHQETTPRGTLRVVAARLARDRRTLALTTDPHPQSVRYALTLPGVRAADSRQPSATIDLAYELNGVETRWFERGNGAVAEWSGWLPHVDWQVSAAFVAHSAEHERLTELLRRKGRLQLRTRLALPAGKANLRIEASAPFEFSVGGKPVNVQAASAGRYVAVTTFDEQPELLALDLNTGSARMPEIHATYSTASDPTPRPLPLGALLLPWAPAKQPPSPLPTENTELAGGDYERGRALFFGERLKCATCHRLRGEGGNIGPDLSNLVHRDAASVLRDIKEPSATINPDYVAYNVRLRDGGELTGFVRTQTSDSLRIVGSDGKEQLARRDDVSDMRPSAISLMPTALLEGLKDEQIRDLMTFLVHEPPTRSRADVEAVLGQRTTKPSEEQLANPLNIVLVASKQDHGPGQHDYPAWQQKWSAMLGAAPGINVTNAWEWPTQEQWRSAHVVVFYYWNHDWSAERYQQLDDYQARGGGAVVFHSATIADKEPEKLAERIGLAAQPGPTKYLHTPLALIFVAPTNHAVTRGFKQLNLLDEPYWPMIGDTNRIEVLAAAEMEGQAKPLVWTFQKGKGRVFASIPGHYDWTFDDPLFRILALRGVAWAAGEPVGRLERQSAETGRIQSIRQP